MTRGGAVGATRTRTVRRTLLSIFFVLHWGAVAVYLLPAESESLEALPDWMEAPTAWFVPRAVHTAWPVARRYLDLTATRQHWTLFAPWPAGWKNSIRVVPYFAVPGRGDLWRADTLVVAGALERSYPHVLDHRTYRVLYNLGYDDTGEFYRPWFAREMCRTLRTSSGQGPEGVSLVALWWPIEVPWEAESEEAYRQFLGGFNCPSEDRQGASAQWVGYGLPTTLDVSEWPTVSARDTTGSVVDTARVRSEARR